MAKIVADLVLETSTTLATASYVLLGAVTGFRAFSSVCANNDTAEYYAADVDANGVPSGGWETGLGTWGTGGVLARTTIYASSNAGAAVSWGAGTRRIALVSSATGILSPSLLSLALSGKMTVTTAGDQFQLTTDISPTREGSWSVTASGAMYTLAGDFVTWYRTHNTALDGSGNFLGRDATGDAYVWMVTEGGMEYIYYSVSASVGVVPTGWIRTMSNNIDTGDLVQAGSISAASFNNLGTTSAMARGFALP